MTPPSASDDISIFGTTPSRDRNQSAERERIQKMRDERNALSKNYRAWKRKDMKRILEGANGARMINLFRWARRLEITEGGKLVEACRAPWIAELGPDQRYLVVSTMSRIISAKRENLGLHPFDDPLPGQPDNVFLQIKKLLRVN